MRGERGQVRFATSLLGCSVCRSGACGSFLGLVLGFSFAFKTVHNLNHHFSHIDLVREESGPSQSSKCVCRQ